jgi:hypothetical protein
MAKKKPKTSKPEADKAGEDDEFVVLCFKVLMFPKALVPGCSKRPCSDCGQMVWISPATQAHMADKPHRVCCAECVAKDSDEDIQVMPPSEGQIAEIVANNPEITPAQIRRKFPASNPKKRKTTMEELLRRTRRRKRLDN